MTWKQKIICTDCLKKKKHRKIDEKKYEIKFLKRNKQWQTTELEKELFSISLLINERLFFSIFFHFMLFFINMMINCHSSSIERERE